MLCVILSNRREFRWRYQVFLIGFAQSTEIHFVSAPNKTPIIVLKFWLLVLFCHFSLYSQLSHYSFDVPAHLKIQIPIKTLYFECKATTLLLTYLGLQFDHTRHLFHM
jgi:hypothetical protein